MDHFADRLTAAVRVKGNAVCVGLDPRWDALPQQIRNRHVGGTLEAAAMAVEEFCLRVVDLVAPLVPVVKPQSAFFEAFGPDGMRALQAVLCRAREQGLLTILDAKRNDIASTATAYAEAAFGGTRLGDHFQPVWNADALTVNPYLGRDSVEPFLQSARRSGRGVFILVRTSNRGAKQFQDLDCGGKPLYQHVAEAVRSWTKEHLGSCGYGDVGAVVGATYPTEVATLRRAMPEVIFLVPGFGVQGGNGADAAPAFRADGLGAVVNNSRGIVSSFAPETHDWEAKIVEATRNTIRALAMDTPMGKLANP
jgi:orotidine-5'-phosphate decarboxylase